MRDARPAKVQCGAGEVPLVAHLRHAAEDESTEAHRLLDLRVPTKDVPYARGPNSAAGRRGRRRSAYEAPRAAADRGTRLGGAESKRRRRPRLPAPPSRVTLLLGDLFGKAAERLREPRHVLPVLDHELPVPERPGALRRELRERGVHLGWSDLELLGEIGRAHV